MITDQVEQIESIGLIEGSPGDCFTAIIKTGKNQGNNLLVYTDLKKLDRSFIEQYDDAFHWHLKDSTRSLNTGDLADPKFEFSYYDRIHKYFGINQMDLALQELVTEKRSRPIVLWDPKVDLQAKNLIPCLTMISFNINFNEVNMSVVFRSRDIIRRLIPNWNALQFFQERIANSLSMKVGTLTDFSLSWFYRNDDLERLRKVL